MPVLTALCSKSVHNDQAAKSVQGHQEDNDLADLLECTEHIAGLAADLGGAQPSHHPDRGGEQDQCREARQRAEEDGKDQNAEGASDQQAVLRRPAGGTAIICRCAQAAA